MDAHRLGDLSASFTLPDIYNLPIIVTVYSDTMSLSSELAPDIPMPSPTNKIKRYIHAPKSKKTKQSLMPRLHPIKLKKRTDPLNAILLIWNPLETFVLSQTRGWRC